MGYSLELFINPAGIDKEFVCSICQEVLKAPTMIQGCEHIFCTTCIQDWTSNSATCPLDRQPIDGFRAPIRAYMNLYNQFRVKCSFGSCSNVCSLGNIESHLNLCEHNPEAIAPCVHNCGALLKMKDRHAHNCVMYLKGKLGKQEAICAFLINKQRKTQQEANELRLQLNSKDAEIKQLVERNEAESKTLKEAIKAKDEEIQKLKRQAQDKKKATAVVNLEKGHPYLLRRSTNAPKRFKFGKSPDGEPGGHKAAGGVRVTNTCECRLCKKD